MPSPSPTPAPYGPPGTDATGPTISSTPKPAEPSTTMEGAQCCHHGGCSSVGTASCSAVGSWCSESEERCRQCAGTFCPALSPRRSCLPSGTGVYDNPSVWEPVCETSGAAGVCPEPMCKWSGGLLEVNRKVSGARTTKRHHFLGAALIQASVTVATTDDTSGVSQGE